MNTISYPTSPGAKNAAAHIIEYSAQGKLTKNADSLAEYIDKECGLAWLIDACGAVLAAPDIPADLRKQCRGALAMAGALEKRKASVTP